MQITPQKGLDLVSLVAQRLTRRGLTMATAESCTGGGIGAELTRVAGSSRWFVGGIISYSNSAKINLLDVPAAALETSGAVSKAVVEAMAIGGCSALKSDLCVAVSGVAGPSGGAPEKPIGSVWIAWAQSDEFVTSEFFHFTGNRQRVRQRTISAALRGVDVEHLPFLLD